MNHMSPLSPTREMPADVVIEMELLGAILIKDRVYEQVSEFLRVEHFFDHANQAVYQAIKAAMDAGLPVNANTLRNNGALVKALAGFDGPQYLAELANAGVTLVDPAQYGRLIVDLWGKRQIILECAAAIERAYSSGIETGASAIGEELLGHVDGVLASDTRQAQIVSLQDAAKEALDDAVEARLSGRGYVGLSSGFRPLDNQLGGLVAGEMTVIAGRPGMGKTALGMAIAERVATENRNVLFVSGEMPVKALALRHLAQKADVDLLQLRRGRQTPFEEQYAGDAVEAAGTLGVHFIQKRGLSAAGLAQKVRALRRRCDLGLVIVDYLQIMGPNEKQRDEFGRVTAVSAEYKQAALDLDIPMIALAQLSREVERRENKRPQLSDLRQSGQIEQDAENIIMLFREEYYLSREEPDPVKDRDAFEQWTARMNDVKGLVELNIEKARNGPGARVMLHFEATRALFNTLASQSAEAPF